MFRTLGAKLALAFAAVTLLAVVLVGAMMMFLLRDRVVASARERVGLVSSLVAEQIASAANNGMRTDALSQFLQQRADELNVRFLLIDSGGTIVTDTAGKLTGQAANQLVKADTGARHSTQSGFAFSTWQEGPNRQIVFDPSAGFVLQRQFFLQNYRLLMLVPEADIAGAWRSLLPRIALSGGIAVIVAAIAGFLLSRSITRPVSRLTRASAEMAEGNYDQRIPVEGRDEIGRMAGAFNQMAHQVDRTLQAMRNLNGNVAHELKTPLTSIQGYSQALIDGIVRTPEEEAHAARVINDEAERMRRLVEDLLELSRLESGQLRIEHEPVQAPALLEEAAERVAWTAREGGKSVRIQSAIDLPVIQGDKRRLEQVLANLLDNAVRHTPAGGVITLSARWSLDSVTIAVHNTGSFIPPEHLDRVFERFYQADPARTRDGRHGGLGLAIAREIVLAHGGTIGAASDPETGTQFTLVLPTDPARPVVPSGSKGAAAGLATGSL